MARLLTNQLSFQYGWVSGFRDPEADYWQGVEAPLFTALDAENVAAIAGQIRATLLTLLRASAPRQPSRWLAVCCGIVLASGPAAMRPSGEAPGQHCASLQRAQAGHLCCKISGGFSGSQICSDS